MEDFTQSENFRKGKRAESVLKYILETRGCKVEPPCPCPPNGASKMDFLVTDYNGSRAKELLVEVKFTAKYFTHSSAMFNCYALEISKFNGYLDYSHDRHKVGYLYIIVGESKLILCQNLQKLKTKFTTEGGITFPVKENNLLLEPNWLFHESQFKKFAQLSAEQLNFILDDNNDYDTDSYRHYINRQRIPRCENIETQTTLIDIAPEQKNDSNQIVELKDVKLQQPITAPNGTVLKIFKTADGTKYVSCYALAKAIGYQSLGYKTKSKKPSHRINQVVRNNNFTVYTEPHLKGGKILIAFEDVPRLLENFCNLDCGESLHKSTKRKLAQELKIFWENKILADNPTPETEYPTAEEPDKIEDTTVEKSAEIEEPTQALNNLNFNDLAEIIHNFEILKEDLPETQAIKAAVKIVTHQTGKNFNL